MATDPNRAAVQTELAYEVFYRPDLGEAVIAVDAAVLGEGALDVFFEPEGEDMYAYQRTARPRWFVLRKLPVQVRACARADKAMLAAFGAAGPVAAWAIAG